MLKKTIKYTDYNDVERTEDFYFNLTKAEVMEMEMMTEGGLSETIQKIIQTKDIPSIVKIFKELVLKAYGEKSADGKHFNKTEEIKNNFAATEAYSNLFMELATDAEAAAAFINGIIPKDLAEKVKEEQAKGNVPNIGSIAIENK